MHGKCSHWTLNLADPPLGLPSWRLADIDLFERWHRLLTDR